MIDVFLTVDVEIWCNGWNDIDLKFSRAFRRYIYGDTNRGHYGLPYQLKVLNAHGLTGVFFVESLFATRFGLAPLSEIVGLLNAARQEVQLHVHPEWVDESLQPLLAEPRPKHGHLRYFSLTEQTTLIAIALDLLRRAGAASVNAFRAGNFAFNCDTLRAVAGNGLRFDSSYNASRFGRESGLLPGVAVVEPTVWEGMHEYPMTVFRDGLGSLRPAQITACSYGEIEGLLWSALRANSRTLVLLSHSAELLNQNRDRPDPVVVRRFDKLCAFLARHPNCFRVRGFHGLDPHPSSGQPAPLSSPPWRALVRVAEQLYRRAVH